MPSPLADAMDTSSQYSSCETLDSHRSSEFDEKNEVNGNDGHQRSGRKVRKLLMKWFRINSDCQIHLKISVEHTDYIVKERVTRAAPPKPAYNPLQFVAIKPSNLFQSAQEQLKKAEEVRKAKEVNKKEEPEDWQNVSKSFNRLLERNTVKHLNWFFVSFLIFSIYCLTGFFLFALLTVHARKSSVSAWHALKN